jgi:hypothetical protein
MYGSPDLDEWRTMEAPQFKLVQKIGVSGYESEELFFSEEGTTSLG